jgi:hypothetical protein
VHTFSLYVLTTISMVRALTKLLIFSIWIGIP